jgi:Protein of unknown function (DUF935)
VAAPLIYDQFSRPLQQGDIYGGAFDPPRDPLANVKGEEVARWIYRDIPLTSFAGNWNIDAIRSALADHRIGLFEQPAQLCDSIFADERVQATLGSRTSGLFSQPMRWYRRGGTKNITREARKMWRKACPQSVWSEIVRWSTMMGFCIVEIVWDTSVTPRQPYLKPWHPMFILYRWDLRQYQVMTTDGPVAAIPGQGKWLVFTPHGHYRGWLQGSVRATSDKWFIKQLAWRDWARFNERHGLPIIKAKVPAAGDPTQKKNFVTGMAGIGQQAVIGLPQNVDGTGYDVELMEARDRAWESFRATIDRCDMAIVLPILGQNLTTEVKEGSFAAARQHGDIRQNFIQFDNETTAECAYRDLLRPWAYFNYGDADLAPYACWNVTPVEDFASMSDVWLKFGQGAQYLRQAGWEIEDIQDMAKSLGLTRLRAKIAQPTQVEAKAVGAGEESDMRELAGQLVQMHRKFRSLDRQIARMRAAA